MAQLRMASLSYRAAVVRAGTDRTVVAAPEWWLFAVNGLVVAATAYDDAVQAEPDARRCGACLQPMGDDCCQCCCAPAPDVGCVCGCHDDYRRRMTP